MKTLWEWISSNGWPLQTIAMKYYDENLSESEKTFSHLELSILTNDISRQISNLHIHEQLIIIDSEETVFTLPFLLGILQSNNSFFICDSNWPEMILRNSFMQLKPSLFICQRQKKAKIYDQIFEHAILSSINLLDQQIDFYQMPSDCYYKDIAYVVSSSGSTGIPKLIFVSHACILPNLEQLKSIFDVQSNDCLFRSTPLTFDPSLIDLFLAIHSSACLCMFSKDIRQNPVLISSIFDRSHCTIAQMTPSFFRQIEQHCHILQLKSLILGGEQFPHISNSTIQQMIQQKKRVVNIYGLTEMSCWASCYILNENDLKRENGIPLGKALDETSIKLERLTDDCFQIILESSTRWTEILSERKFRFETDDLVRYNQETDEIFYLGRRTLTFKRFGIMINLEYIEQIAYQSNLLNECACLVLNEEENYLILLCKFRNENQIEPLKSFLRLYLTEHFLPNLVLPLEGNIPLNFNGKIDRKKLNSLYLNSSSNQNLIHIWQNLINKTPEISSNFISDGGNSLLTLTFTEQIKQFYSSVDINDLFDLILHKTFKDLIEYVNNSSRECRSNDDSFSAISPINSIIKSNVNPIWSIERCSKIFLHHNNHRMLKYSFYPTDLTFSIKQLVFNWKCSMKKCIDASPLIVLLDENRSYVIIGSHAGLINAYQIDQGQLIWSFQTNERIEGSATMSRNGQFVLLGDYSGMLYIINCFNGQLYSSYQCQGLIKTIPSIHSEFDIVYLGAHDQYLHAIQIQENSSKCIWKYGLNGSCASSPQLSADNSHVYVATLSGDILAVQAKEGKFLWKQMLNKPVFSTMTIWKEKFLLIGCVDQKLYCLNTDNGEQKWVFATDGPIFSSPCLFNDTLFIGCHDQYLYAIDLSNEEQGVLKWKCLFPSMIYASPFVSDHGRIVVVGSTDGCLRLLNTQIGEIICEIQVNGNGLFSSPVCYQNFLLVGSRDDYLYCYKLVS